MTSPFYGKQMLWPWHATNRRLLGTWTPHIASQLLLHSHYIPWYYGWLRNPASIRWPIHRISSWAKLVNISPMVLGWIWSLYGYGSIPINTIFSGLFTSINPSYFDVNYRGTRFWHTAIYLLFMGIINQQTSLGTTSWRDPIGWNSTNFGDSYPPWSHHPSSKKVYPRVNLSWGWFIALVFYMVLPHWSWLTNHSRIIHHDFIATFTIINH